MTLMLLLLALFTAGPQYARPELPVETGWLQSHLGDADVRIVDTRDLRPALDGLRRLEALPRLLGRLEPPRRSPGGDGLEEMIETLAISTDAK